MSEPLPSRRVPFLSLLAVILAASPPATAAVGRWTPYGPPSGALISLAASPTGRLFLAAETSGVYASRDGGVTWSWSGLGMGNQPVRALAADPASGELYAVGAAAVFHSTNDGASWRRLARDLPLGAPPPGGDVLALGPGRPAVLFLARGQHLFRGTDGRTSWREVLEAPEPIASLQVDPANPRSVFAGTLSGLLHSADGGTSWSAVTRVDPIATLPPTNPFSIDVRALAAIPTRMASRTVLFAIANLSLYRSRDGGATWHLAAGAPPGTAGDIYSLVASTGPAAELYAIFQLDHPESLGAVGVFRSRDLGSTWKRIDQGRVPLGQLGIDPASGDLLVLASGSLARGRDGGRRWRETPIGDQLCGAEAQEPAGALRFDARSPSRVYAVSGNGLFASDDGGVSWSGRAQALSAEPRCIHIADLALDPRNLDTLYAATDHGIFTSVDAGLAWRPLLAAEGPGDLLPFETVAVTASGVLLGGGCGVWRSADAGVTWEQTFACDPTDDLAPEVGRLILDPLRPQVVYAEVLQGDPGGFPGATFSLLFRSSDGGLSWSQVISASNAVALDARAAGTLYLLTPQGLEKSVDDGISWRTISNFALGSGSYSPFGAHLVVDPGDSRVLWAATDGVWRSADGGVTWQPVDAGLGGLPALSLFLDPSHPGHLGLASEGFLQISWDAEHP